MSSFSSILDVSSFFIGVLVNLLLVAMICFYFKRKIDNLELSQSEQAKMLFQLIQEQSQSQSQQTKTYSVLNGLDLTQLSNDGDEEENEASEHGESDESDSDDSENSDDEEVETKTIEYEEVAVEESSHNDYSKMTVKELRQLLENKGVPLISRNMKKQELIELVVSANNPVIEEVVKVEDEGEMNVESQEHVEDEDEDLTQITHSPEISDIN